MHGPVSKTLFKRKIYYCNLPFVSSDQSVQMKYYNSIFSVYLYCKALCYVTRSINTGCYVTRLTNIGGKVQAAL